MELLIIFILGILFIELIFPFLTTLFEVLTTYLETKKAKYGLIITESNAQIKRINEDEGHSENKRVIGFITEDTLEKEDDYEDD